MNLKNILPFIAAGLIVSSVLTFSGKIIKLPTVFETILQGDAPLNQQKRFEWEFMRLRDPKTGKIPSNIRQASLAYAQTLPGSMNFLRNKKDHSQSVQWELRGPSNIGGRTRALALDVLNENTIIAGGVSGGMWRSTDGGETWIKTTRPEQLQSTSCISQDKRPGKENTWFVGTGEYFNIYGGLRGDGVYKSTDNGKSWFQLESTVSNTPHAWNSFDYVWSVVTDHTNLTENIVYTANAVGSINRSTDGGETWTTVLGEFSNNNNTFSWFIDLVISPSGILYSTFSQKSWSGVDAASVKGIFRSEDGLNWVDITPDFMPELYNRIVVGIAPSDENQVYFLAETPESGKMTTNSRGDSLWHSIWKYTYVDGDGSGEGGIWEDRSDNIPAPERIRSQFNSQGGYDLVIAVKPDNPDLVIIGGTNLYRSTDGFLTPVNTTHIGGYCWDDTSCYEIYTYTNHHADEHAITFLPSDPNVMFSGSDGGVAKTYNVMAEHVDWESLNNGYFTTQFYTCSIDHAIPGSAEVIGGLQDNGTLYTNSFDANKGWYNAAGADGFHCAIADSGKALYTSNNTSKQPFIKIWRTFLDDDGKTIIKTRVDPDGAADMIWNTPFRLDPNDTRRMYLAGGSILWRNNNLDLIPITDSKDSTSIGWDSLSFTRTDSLVAGNRDERISAVVVSKNPANVVYYGTTYGRVFRLDNADVGDPVPLNITWNGFPKLANVGCVAVDPHDANKIFVVFTNYSQKSIFYSTNGGNDWTHVSGNLEESPSGTGAGPAVYWLEILPVDGKNIYFAGTSTGLYSTVLLDGDYTVWQQEGAETIGNAMIYMLDSRESDGFITAASFGVGMYSANYTSLPDLPKAPVLISPANDSTGILDEVLLSWESEDDSYLYILQTSKNEDFNEIIREYDGLKVKEQIVSSLEQGMVKYYWRVVARGAAGKSLPSETGTFITATKAPDAEYPDNNTEEIEPNLSIKWKLAEGADSYHFQLCETNFFTELLADTILSSTDINITGLDDGKRYYWRVSSIRNGQEGLFSSKYRFKTKLIVGIEEAGFLGDDIILKGSYPNPINDESNISFYLKKEEKIELILCNESGKKIRTLTSGKYSRGSYSIRLDAKGLSAGIYYCILNTRKNKKMKQIIVVK